MDTKCQACPTGFWSVNVKNHVKCIPCQKCNVDQILVKHCTQKSNTLCCPKQIPNCSNNTEAGKQILNQNGLIFICSLTFLNFKTFDIS